MNRKTLTWLGVVAVLLTVLAIIGQNRNDSRSIAGVAAGQLLLPELADAIDSVVEITISGGGSERLVTLERNQFVWGVAELGGYPADFSKIRTLLVALAEARIVEEKTANPEFHSRLGVESIDAADALGLEVAIQAPDFNGTAIVFGGEYGASERYVRRSGDNQSFLIDRNPGLAPTPTQWVDSDILDIQSSRVQRVEISHGDGEMLVIYKASPDDSDFLVEAIPEERDLQYLSVANVTANALSRLRLEQVARALEEQTEATVVSEYWAFDGLVITVSVIVEDDQAWLGFNARFDTDQAVEFAVEAPADGIGVATEPSSILGTETEASEINARLSGWRYQIPTYLYDQITRRIEDLLAPLADTSE